MTNQTLAPKNSDFNLISDFLSNCTIAQALEISAYACLCVGEKAAELKAELPKPKQFNKKLSNMGLAPTEINKYIKLHSASSLRSMTNLGAAMLFSLSGPRYTEVRSLVSELPNINQVDASVVKKNFAPAPKKKDTKTELHWKQGRGGGNTKLEIAASLPAGTLSDRPGVAEWVESRYKESGNMFGVLSDCYKESERLYEAESRIKELEKELENAALNFEPHTLETESENITSPAPAPNLEPLILDAVGVEDVQETIKSKLKKSESVFDPYYQVANLAHGLKYLASLRGKQAEYEKNLKLLKLRTSIESIWFDEAELINNHRLLFVPDGEDFISYFEEMRKISGNTDVPSSQRSSTLAEPVSASKALADADCVAMAQRPPEAMAQRPPEAMAQRPPEAMAQRPPEAMAQRPPEAIAMPATEVKAVNLPSSSQTKTNKPVSILESFENERSPLSDEDQIERFAAAIIGYTDMGSIGWAKIATMANRDSSQLKKICRGLNDADKISLRQCLASYLVENPDSIKSGSMNWLHHASLGGALKLLTFRVDGQDDCTFNLVFSFKEKGLERWHFNSQSGEVVNCTRDQFEITGFIF